MPSKNKTELLKLNQWQENEYPKMDDFNSDNKKIDDAYEGIVSKLNDKADKEGLKVHLAKDVTEDTLVREFENGVTICTIADVRHFPSINKFGVSITYINKLHGGYGQKVITSDGDIWSRRTNSLTNWGPWYSNKNEIDQKADKFYVDDSIITDSSDTGTKSVKNRNVLVASTSARASGGDAGVYSSRDAETNSITSAVIGSWKSQIRDTDPRYIRNMVMLASNDFEFDPSNANDNKVIGGYKGELSWMLDSRNGEIYAKDEVKIGDMKVKKEIVDLKQSGVEINRILVDALNSKEVKASTNDNLRTNAKKVYDIELGSKVPLKATDDLIIIGSIPNKSTELKWSSPSNLVCNGVTITEFKEDVLVRNKYRIPVDINDGTKLGTFSKNQHKYKPFIDTNIQLDTDYFYAVFSISKNNLITKNASGKIFVRSGIPIKELPIGALIKDKNSKYYGEPIIWLKLEDEHPGYPKGSTTLITEQIICLKAMDAKEPNNSNSDRRDFGNNRYIHSNLRQWLNSSASNWYSAQHSADAPPTSFGVSYNAYDKEKGFMANLTPELRSAILPTSLKVTKNPVDGGGLESFTDKIFIPSCTEVGLSNDTSYDEGTKFDYFKSNSDRVATTTKECVENSDYTSSGLKPDDTWYWWTRTPYSSSSNPGLVRSVHNDGSRNRSSADYGHRGVRPALNLDSETLVFPKPDSNGVYELLF